jgi:hypothetical protein
VTRLAPVTGLALHELWISFRLLVVIGVVLLATLPAALLPSTLTPSVGGAPPGAIGWYAVALAGALSLVSAVAAATIARERRRGTAGWLVVRAVPRASILVAWFAAFVLLEMAALIPAGLIGWLSLENTLPPSGPTPFAAALFATAASGAAALAVGMLAGCLLRPLVAALVALLLTAAPLIGPAAGAWDLPAVPGGGLAVLTSLATDPHPIADSLLAAGTALGLTAALLLVCVAAFERADL